MTNEFDDLVETIKGTWPDSYHAQGIAGAVIKKGWIGPAEARQRELHHFEVEQENADLRAEQARQVEYVRDRLPDHDQHVHDLTDWLTALVDRVEAAEGAKETAFEAGRQAGKEAAWDEAYQEGWTNAMNTEAENF